MSSPQEARLKNHTTYDRLLNEPSTLDGVPPARKKEARNEIGLLRFETEIIPRSGSFIVSAVTLATTVS